MKIISVVGARPNLVKIAPLLREIGKYPQIESLLVHTGQHYDEELSRVFFRQLNIPDPDFNLAVGSGSHAWQTAEVLKRIEPILIQRRPDLVLVVGDVNSTMAASLAAAKLGIRIAHVEAGLRSFDRRMPEETNRVVTDVLAHYLFSTEEDAIQNLVREGRSSENIYMVGNVMIDALRYYLPFTQRSRMAQDLGLAQNGSYHPYAVLTLHRPATVESLETLRSLLKIIDEVGERLPVVFAIHPRTQANLNKLGESKYSNIRIIPPVGYLDFLGLISRSKLVLTDSGGIQEETTALGIPCLTLRENTERPVTVSHGTNEIVGLNPTRIHTAVDAVLAGNWKVGRLPPLWDGHAAERIINVLRKELS